MVQRTACCCQSAEDSGDVASVVHGEEHLAEAPARARRLAGFEEGRETMLGESDLRKGARRREESVGDETA